jgi:hypothetical protein
MRDREVEERWKRKMNANARLLWFKYDHPQLRGVAMKKIKEENTDLHVGLHGCWYNFGRNTISC